MVLLINAKFDVLYICCNKAVVGGSAQRNFMPECYLRLSINRLILMAFMCAAATRSGADLEGNLGSAALAGMP